MDIRKRLVKWATGAWGLPLIYRVPAIVFLVVFSLYVFIFMPPKEVAFSFAASETCVDHFTVLPGILRQSGDGHFKMRATSVISVAGVGLVSTKVCIAPIKSPVEGTYSEAVSPNGTWLLKKAIIVKVGKLPVVGLDALRTPVPTSRPLGLQITADDRVFDYQMTANGKTAKCLSWQRSLACDVPALKLAQGKQYTVSLERSFHGMEKIAVTRQKIATLSATRVIKSSVKQGQVIYSKPRSFTFNFDKDLEGVTPRLYQIIGSKKQEVAVTSTHSKRTLQVKLAKDLPRSSTFSLVLDSLQAVDGSSLATPYVLHFKTSGGPRVVGVSVGSIGVPLGATVVVSFDQTLSAQQDVSKLVTLAGGAAYAGKSGNQLFITLASVPLCGDFSIKLGSSFQSNYGIAGSSSWTFFGRTICHTTSTIGYSVNGRPIVAYTFGSGSAVLYTGAIHGNEVNTTSLMYSWIDDLEARARSIPSGRSVVVVPEINPDGVAMGSRTNAHNIDLNRNFATNDWRKDITDVNNNPFPGGGGPSPMSEPETQVIAGFAQRLRPSLILSYHSIGGLVAANLAGASGSYASTYSRLSGYYNATGKTDEAFEYSVSGTADDWYAQKLGIASVLVELSSRTYSQFGQNESAMWAMLQ